MSFNEPTPAEFAFAYVRERIECILRVHAANRRELAFHFHARAAGVDGNTHSQVVASGAIEQEYSGDSDSTSTYLLHRLFSHRQAAEMEPLQEDQLRLQSTLAEWIRETTPQGVYRAAARFGVDD